MLVSIVSHGHGDMVLRLVNKVLTFPEVDRLILTLNTPERTPKFEDSRVFLIENHKPMGFGANHNQAFNKFKSTKFCILNPDITFHENPFPSLLEVLEDKNVGVVAPRVIQENFSPEDSMRFFLTPLGVLKRIFGLNLAAYSITHQDSDIEPDWVAGMFMLFNSETYNLMKGFDERYFMYCEDADICTRIWKIGSKVIGKPSVSVVHDARRGSRHKLNHLYWHISSLFYYFYRHSFSLPQK
jgi:N-acetylglucosaminyl-diphospho-decaprenol L-rhamnosyltransferase